MMKHLRFFIGGSSFLDCIEESKMNLFHAHVYRGLPLQMSFGPVDALKTAGVVFAHALILAILRVIAFAQVGKSVIGFAAVYMVYLIPWPFSCHVQPSKAVGFIRYLINFYRDIALICRRPSYVANPSASLLDQPYEDSGLWIIAKNATQVLCRTIGISHDAVTSLIGQGPARVDSACGLRHFSAEVK